MGQGLVGQSAGFFGPGGTECQTLRPSMRQVGQWDGEPDPVALAPKAGRRTRPCGSRTRLAHSARHQGPPATHPAKRNKTGHAEPDLVDQKGEIVNDT